MRHWTAEECLRQSQLIQNWKPWLLAGVKTPTGKTISKMNAYKHGLRSAPVRNVLCTITKQKQKLNKLKKAVNL
jgi:hypothetical protein